MVGEFVKRICGLWRPIGACLLLCGTGMALSSCIAVNAALQHRNEVILAEPAGDYFIGRRYFTRGTRFWGYLRRPGELWKESRLVIFNESRKHQPDRVLEVPIEGPAHGFDHNHEYRIRGYFSGEEIYDPNSNYILPEFVLEDWTRISADPGFLFHPDEIYDVGRLPFRR